MANKNLKKTKIKIRELPSFLFTSPTDSENINFGKKTVKKGGNLGPVFFGCYDYQPIFHRLNLGLTFEARKSASSTENLLRDAFISEAPTDTWYEEKEVRRCPRKRQVSFYDPYLHKCPGYKRAWAPRPAHKINLGETISTIEGEASEEIPLYCVRESFDGWPERDYEIVYLSDIWERRRMYMPSKERIAHTHFPKQFVTLQVIGPTIPASIIIKKLPSKRKTDSQLDFELKSKTKKEVKKSDVKTKKEFVEPAENVKDEVNVSVIETQTVEIVVKNEDEAKERSIEKGSIEKGSIDEELHDNNDTVDEVSSHKEEEIKNEDDLNETTDEVLTE